MQSANFNKLFILSIVCFFSLCTSAKSKSAVKAFEAINLFQDDETKPFEKNLDSLLVSYYLTKSAFQQDLELEVKGKSTIPTFHDSVYMKRLEFLSEHMEMEMPYNEKVQSYIKMYAEKRRSLVETMLGLSEYYFPLFEQELDRQGLPLELKYLPIIESALNPSAFSHAGASGLWQFVYGTGKFYNLYMDTYVDERRDPVKATKAAVKYLGDLYKIYGDWYMVIAAYNCGPGNVNKAIRRTGGKRDYWEIYYRLPRETRGYVPAFIAATYIMNFHLEHDLYAQQHDLPLATDTIMLDEPIHLLQVSEKLDIPYDMVKILNPQYRRFYIPGGSKKYALRLPSEKIAAFIDQRDEVLTYKKDELVNAKRTYAAPVYSSYTPDAPSNMASVIYTVKSGDNLGWIAEWYDVGLSKIRYWNNIYSNKIRVGQKLKIYVPKNKVTHYMQINKMSFAEKQALDGKPIKTNPVPASPAKIDNNYVYYKVRRGDSLWEIARKYPGISSSDIQRLNNMSGSSKIKVGQMLKIKRKS